MSYAGKHAYSADKTSGVLRGGASGANKGYVLANCAPTPLPHVIFFYLFGNPQDRVIFERSLHETIIEILLATESIFLWIWILEGSKGLH